MRKKLLEFSILFVASCASSKLIPGANSVQIGKSSPNMDSYEYLGDVSCSYMGSFSSVSSIIISCRNDLKNETAKKSGTLVVIENEQLGSGDCLKCITMIGSAYKEKL